MTRRGFLSRHRIARHAIREDAFSFAIPGMVVFVAGLVVSGRDGYDGLTPVIWNLIRHPRSLFLLSAWNIAGLLMYVVGLSVAVVALGTLKRSYSSTLVVREDHQLITHGIYRLARHPIYLGALMICFGVPVYASSLYGLLTMTLLIPLVLNRIRIEERLLTEQLGDAYRRYRKTTRKLIPFVY